ncbi:glycosyltransferase family 4 protein [Ornithinimicrobium avium]|uniref:D-inositol 3-phosphate glycosyltransferase n=1 Tax=Ornithinimicrobium avium TaxID=2283195 RepID=A0A345NMZ5_9MICO|nr:glycosyltransferase family 4 protein [Ornithinimicrobium avium]AXH96403.1 glycosyltransferase [Ornithinimicrobium avium]
MRVLVYPHDLAIGGSQINAIELARGVADLGHEVMVFGCPGPLVAKVHALGLDFVPAPRPRRRPSRSVVASLVRTVEERGIDVVHGYEWPPILECWLAARRTGCAVVGTVMSMAVADFIPRSVPLAVGTEQIADAERRAGRSAVDVIEPPVDLEANHPGLGLNTAGFRAAYGIRPEEVLVVVVSRLAVEMKREGLLVASRVVAELSTEHAVRMLVVGNGPARQDLEDAVVTARPPGGADPAVQLVGELADPRVAYAAADVSLGMGSSALRAMAFGKPVVVQGEKGFWRTVRPDTLAYFLWTGWYGVGDGPETGPARLRGELLPLVTGAASRRELGAFALRTVQERFSLDAAARSQVDHYRRATTVQPGPAADGGDLPRTAWRFVRYRAGRAGQRLTGRRAADDFNARPVAAAPTGPARRVSRG